MDRPAPRDGVSPSRVGVGPERYEHVAHFLSTRFPAVQDWPQRLARGDVLNAKGQALNGTEPCTNGMLIWYWRHPPPESRVPFEVELLHQDEHLVVVDKPHFLPVTPGGRHLHETVLVRLKQTLGIDTLAPMHRLDRDTAGVLVFTVQPHTRNAYSALLRDRKVHKVYEAVAPWHAGLRLPLQSHIRLQGRADRQFMQAQVVSGEPNAHTLIELISVLNAGPDQPLAHYRLTPTTGRRHQLRAQMNALGLPIVGDRVYPTLRPEDNSHLDADYSQPLRLLARSLSFIDPITAQPRRFVSSRRLV
jgi:tRNA pseudouridine32 synthase / 23S rRNA pseudouridine746 synthase